MHAKASSKAVAKHCHCAHVDAFDKAFGSASKFFSIAAKAYAEAAAIACATGAPQIRICPAAAARVIVILASAQYPRDRTAAGGIGKEEDCVLP